MSHYGGQDEYAREYWDNFDRSRIQFGFHLRPEHDYGKGINPDGPRMVGDIRWRKGMPAPSTVSDSDEYLLAFSDGTYTIFPGHEIRNGLVADLGEVKWNAKIEVPK